MRLLWWWITFKRKPFTKRPEPQPRASVLDEIIHDDWYTPKKKHREKEHCLK